MSNITSKFKIKNLVVALATMTFSLSAVAQEAGEINWKQWNVVIPVDAGGGYSTFLEGKAAKKAPITPEYRKYIKQNSNSTIELRSPFTGITESGEYGLSQGKYSSSELVEAYNKNNYWPNTGSHILESRLKVYKINGVGTTYISRIVSENKTGEQFDKVRIMWRDGYILAEVRESYSGGIRYKRTKIAEVGENMFNMAFKVSSGRVTLNIVCKNTGVERKSVPVTDLGKTATSKNLFRIGNLYKNDQNTDDSVTVQIKYVTLTHEDKK